MRPDIVIQPDAERTISTEALAFRKRIKVRDKGAHFLPEDSPVDVADATARFVGQVLARQLSSEAACYLFRSTHVVIDRRFCTTVVLIGSTSSAPRSFVTCINIASSTRCRSVPSAIAYQRSCRCRTRPSAPIVDASRQKKSPPGLSVRQQPCSIAWK